jgi:ABC-2 type transport system ATP-binding protein
VLILDEPASGLDPRARIELKRLLLELKAAGKTILVSSHILAELADYCTTVGLMHQGQLLFCGPIDSLTQQFHPVRRVHIRVVDSPEPALRLLESSSGVRWLATEDRTISCEVEASDVDLANLLRELVLQGARIYSFTEEQPSLEDLFLRATNSTNFSPRERR